MKFLLGTTAYNQHVQNIALALHEAGALGAYFSGGVDNYRHAWARCLRRWVANASPAFDRQLRRRRVEAVPDALVYADRGWEGVRTIAATLNLDERVLDWLWERSEYRLERRCAAGLLGDEFDAFVGVEHGSLAAVKTAKRLGKPSMVAFLSPHHTTRQRWVDIEYEKFPELETEATRTLLRLGQVRDARRHEEACLADAILANSSFVEQSLVAAGLPRERICTVPLGSPQTISAEELPQMLPTHTRILYAGPVSIRKGAHHLLRAWLTLAPHAGAELHCYGVMTLPAAEAKRYSNGVVWHGSVPQSELFAAYRQASILVFPTLCDGFGSVVSEALAHGLPVITTRNAGAADLIDEGRNGFIVPPGDIEALAERLEWCLRHPSDLLSMRRAALDTARQWTWTHFRAEVRRQLSHVLHLPQLIV